MSEKISRLGQCIICGDRVFREDRYITSTEGYCHHACLKDTAVVA